MATIEVLAALKPDDLDRDQAAKERWRPTATRVGGVEGLCVHEGSKTSRRRRGFRTSRTRIVSVVTGDHHRLRPSTAHSAPGFRVSESLELAPYVDIICSRSQKLFAALSSGCPLLPSAGKAAAILGPTAKTTNNWPSAAPRRPSVAEDAPAGAADATEIMSPGEVVVEGVVVEQPAEPATAGEVFGISEDLSVEYVGREGIRGSPDVHRRGRGRLRHGPRAFRRRQRGQGAHALAARQAWAPRADRQKGARAGAVLLRPADVYLLFVMACLSSCCFLPVFFENWRYPHEDMAFPDWAIGPWCSRTRRGRPRIYWEGQRHRVGFQDEGRSDPDLRRPVLYCQLVFAATRAPIRGDRPFGPIRPNAVLGILISPAVAARSASPGGLYRATISSIRRKTSRVP